MTNSIFYENELFEIILTISTMKHFLKQITSTNILLKSLNFYSFDIIL